MSAPASDASTFSYVGGELALFERAVRWKTYVASRIREYLVGDVLEVGAGIGGTTRILCDGRQTSWTALEPDPELARQLELAEEAKPFALPLDVRVGTLADIGPIRRFDAILYMDVLEHIECDADELMRATSALKPGGRVIVLSPAHEWLYSEFDREIGHFRRYSAATLASVAPSGVLLEKMIYLDAAGLFASLGNRFVLHRSLPTQRQIDTWDRLLVPISRAIDPMLRYRVGKSILAVWRARS